MWRVRRVRLRGARYALAVRARHRVWPWKTIVVSTRDLRFGAEAVARYLEGRPAGHPVHCRRWRPPAERARDAQRNRTAAGGAL